MTLDDGRNVEVLRVRDARAKRIKLSVSERGARLTLPLRASLVAGDRFLAEHRAWLSSQLDRLAVADGAALEPGLADRLPLRGEAVPLRGSAAVSCVCDATTTACIARCPKRSDAAWRRALRDFYEAQARADVGRWLQRYLHDLPRAPRRVHLK